MSLSAFLLVLAAACCHATWNLCVKTINGGPALVWLFSAVSTVLYLPFAIAVFLIEKPSFGAAEWGFIGGSAVLHLAYFLLLQQAYRVGDLSVVYPTARATGPLLATVIAVTAMGAPFTAQIAAGGLAIIVGVMFLSGGVRRGQGAAALSIGFGLLVGSLIATYTVWDAYAVSVMMISPLLLDYVSGAGRTVVLAPLAWKRIPEIRRYWRDHRAAVLCIAIFNPLAYILVLYALTYTSVVYVAPTRELSVLMVIVLGSVVLGEGELRRRLGWAVLIIAGVVLLATG